MYELKDSAEGFLEIKGSKFYAFIEPCSDIRAIRARQSELKALHPKAVHVVYAARALNEYSQVVEDFSDDGEPKGSSAAPMLNVLRGANLLAQAFIVRYFGGTLLGVGGLVRAYSSALNEAIKNATLCEYELKKTYLLDVPYEQYRLIEYLCADYELSAEFAECVKIKLSLNEQQADEFAHILREKCPNLKIF